MLEIKCLELLNEYKLELYRQLNSLNNKSSIMLYK